MMFRNRSLGVDVLVDCPDSPAALDQMVGEKGASMKAALRYYLYHSWNGPFRESLAAAVQEKTGIERPQAVKGGEPQFETKKDDDGNETQVPVLISEQAYINKVMAEGALSEDEYATLAQEVADGIPFNPQASRRGLKPAAKHLDFADRYLAAVEAGAKTQEEFISTFDDLNAPYTFATLGDGDTMGEFNRENIALAVRINEERKLKDVGADF